jgi:hypothetical protein
LDLVLEALPIVEETAAAYREQLGERSYFTQQANERLSIMESIIASSEMLRARRELQMADSSKMRKRHDRSVADRTPFRVANKPS